MRSRRVWQVLGAGALALVMAAAMLSTVGATPGPAPGDDTSEAPMSVNPDQAKVPITDPPPFTPEPVAPMSNEEQIRYASDSIANDPSSSIICLTAAGSVAGIITTERVDTTVPISAAQAADLCIRTWPGSEPLQE